LKSYGKLVAEIFNGSVSLTPGDDNYYYSTWSSTVVVDTIGSDRTECSNSFSIGLKGFEVRVSNAAVDMTNA
jgi:hypothetical protein